jgi:hypothetical protein
MTIGKGKTSGVAVVATRQIEPSQILAKETGRAIAKR